MGRPLWFIGLLERAFRGRYALARLTRIPLLGKILRAWLFDGDQLMFLPKGNLLTIHQPLHLPEQTVLPSDVAAHFVKQATHHWIMNFCICRRAAGCTNYPIDLGCLFLGKAVLNINPRLGRLVSREEALEHLSLCRELGLVHLIGRTSFDSFWLGAGPSEQLLTICNCCPCCCLGRVLPELDPSISAMVTKMPTVQVFVTDRCVGCGHCMQGVCFVNAIHLCNGRAVISDACRGCGRCVEVCPHQAIELTYSIESFHAAAIDQISTLVDVE